MPLNADQLLAVFPHPVLTKIVGETNLASSTHQQSEHNGNLASIKSNLAQLRSPLRPVLEETMVPATRTLSSATLLPAEPALFSFSLRNLSTNKLPHSDKAYYLRLTDAAQC